MRQGQRPISLCCTLIFLRPMHCGWFLSVVISLQGRTLCYLCFIWFFSLISDSHLSSLLQDPAGFLLLKEQLSMSKVEDSGRAFSLCLQAGLTYSANPAWRSCSQWRGYIPAGSGLLSLSCMQKCKTVLPGADGKMGPISSYSSGFPVLQICERIYINILVM